MEQFTSVKHINDPFMRICVSIQNRIDCLFLPPTKLAASLDIKRLSAKIEFVTLSTAPTTSGGTCRVNTRAKKVGCFLHNISLADFLKTILIWSHLSEKGRKAVFYPHNWTRKSHQQDEKRRKRKSQEERSKKEKSNGTLFAFMMATLEIVLAEKNCLSEEVYLPVTSSKIRLERCYIKSLFHKAVQNTHGEKNEAVALQKLNELYQILNWM